MIVKKDFTVKIKTYLWSGIVMGIISIILLAVMPSQVRIPGFDSGAPSPRVLPGTCLTIMLVCSIYLIIQSLVFKKEKIFEWKWSEQKPVIVLTLLICLFVALIVNIGFVLGGLVALTLYLFYIGERKPTVYAFTWVMTVAIFFLFKVLFHISLPMSPFGLPF